MRRGIVIPTYNEYNNIERVVNEIFRVEPDLHVLVVDDNSPDRTGEKVKELGERYSGRVKLITQNEKRGLGQAYVCGFTEALRQGWTHICEMDADLSHKPIYLRELFSWSRSFDLVMGSRYTPGGGVENWNFSRRLLSMYGNLYARTVLGAPIADLTSGFRCYRRKVLESINLSDIRSNGYAFQIETAYRTWLNGFRIKEIPIVFIEREQGKSKMSKSIVLEAVGMVWKLRFNKDKLIARPPEPVAVPDTARRRVKGARRKKVRKGKKVPVREP
jgi:dolichol-phosphate mannosyltransferase